MHYLNVQGHYSGYLTLGFIMEKHPGIRSAEMLWPFSLPSPLNWNINICIQKWQTNFSRWLKQNQQCSCFFLTEMIKGDRGYFLAFNEMNDNFWMCQWYISASQPPCVSRTSFTNAFSEQWPNRSIKKRICVAMRPRVLDASFSISYTLHYNLLCVWNNRKGFKYGTRTFQWNMSFF